MAKKVFDALFLIYAHKEFNLMLFLSDGTVEEMQTLRKFLKQQNPALWFLRVTCNLMSFYEKVPGLGHLEFLKVVKLFSFELCVIC